VKIIDDMEKTIATYNETAQEYAVKTDGFTLDEHLDRFTAQLPTTSTRPYVLDFGCGPGRDAYELGQRGCEVVGVDASEELLKLAQSWAPTASFLQKDMRDCVVTPQTFDGVWANASLLHLSKKDLPGVLHNISYMLKDDGLLFATLKFGEGEKLVEDSRYHGLPKFYAYYDENEIVDFLGETGFNPIEVSMKTVDNPYFAHPWMNIYAKKQ
jgi:SAM-dependent methyltransferase